MTQSYDHIQRSRRQRAVASGAECGTFPCLTEVVELLSWWNSSLQWLSFTPLKHLRWYSSFHFSSCILIWDSFRFLLFFLLHGITEAGFLHFAFYFFCQIKKMQTDTPLATLEFLAYYTYWILGRSWSSPRARAGVFISHRRIFVFVWSLSFFFGFHIWKDWIHVQ